MPTLPKVTVRQPQVDTRSCLSDDPVSSTAHFGFVGDDYQVDGRNRKERRKAAATKRARMRNSQLDKPQNTIYNAFRGY